MKNTCLTEGEESLGLPHPLLSPLRKMKPTEIYLSGPIKPHDLNTHYELSASKQDSLGHHNLSLSQLHSKTTSSLLPAHWQRQLQRFPQPLHNFSH